MLMDGDGDDKTMEAVVPELEDVVPIYDRIPYGGGDTGGGSGGERDSDRFLANDGVVQNWDAWENAWAKSFDDLAVRRYGKHTCGTVSVETSRRKDRRSGAVGKRSRGAFDGKNDKGVTFSYVVGSDQFKERNLMHPLLVIYSGYTHYQLSQSMSTSPSTGPNYQKIPPETTKKHHYGNTLRIPSHPRHVLRSCTHTGLLHLWTPEIPRGGHRSAGVPRHASR